MTDIEIIEMVKNKIGKSYNAICKELGIGRNTFSDIKQGKCSISDKVARKMQEVYGFSETWLLTGEGNMFKNEPTPSIMGNNINNVQNGNNINSDIAVQELIKQLSVKDSQIAWLQKQIDKKNA